MSKQSSQEGIALRYTQAFHCIGPECPDTCCKSWKIPLEKEALKKWQKILSEDELAQTVEKYSDNKNPAFVAKIKLSADGNCQLLNNRGLCSIHEKYGEEYLPHICKTYPRALRSVRGHYELSMSMACPEVARLGLLNSTATDLVSFDAGDLIKHGFASSQRSTKEAPIYFKSLDSVRDIMLYIFSMREITVQQRLFVAAWFSQKISVFININSKKFNEEELLHQLEELSSPGVLPELCAQFQGFPESCEFALPIVRGILFQRLHTKDTIGALMGEVMGTYGFEYSRYDEDGRHYIEMKSTQGSAEERFAEIVPVYLSRRNRVQQKYGQKIDIYLENYCRQYLVLNLFVDFESPYAQMKDLVVRLAVIRFLFYSHPGLDRLLDNENVQPGDFEILDKVIVDVVYKFSRGIEHAYGFLQKIYDELEQLEMNELHHYVLLMKM
ncbi:MAG: flagellin lysine-N-methylase [Gammaproteobacteria bacterium]|nr:flagellin lysine-N-methylase [Gammaproteobacteria bacterium]